MSLWPLLLLIAVAVAGAVLAWSRPWAWLPIRQAKQPTQPETPQPPGAGDETLSIKLHRLGQKIEEFVTSSSHPNDLTDRAEFNEAVGLLSNSDVPLDTVVQYATGANANLACAAFAALAQRPDRDKAASAILRRLGNIWPYPIYFALLYLDAVKDRPAMGAPVAYVQPWWAHNPVIFTIFADYFDRRDKLGDRTGFGNALDGASKATIDQIDAFLQAITHPAAARLREQLKSWSAARLDRKFLESFGQFWAVDDAARLLVEPPGWHEDLELATETILHDPPQSVLVSGLSRAGKTSFLKLLSMRIAKQGWSVFEAGGAELMAGQVYIGQLEERIRQLIGELDAKKRVAWYVRDLLQIAESGTHKGQAASILDQIVPAITAGRLVILAEASPAGLSRLIQLRPSVRSLIEVYRLEPMADTHGAALVRDVASRLETEAPLTIEPAATDAVLHLSQHYLGANPFPGGALDLLKVSANRALAGGNSVLRAEDVVGTLSQITGLPRSILDDSERIDLGSIRQFFSDRVIGQDEAVTAVVDRIAMLKAGLTDPSRPIGVYLFAGPTGTGKTELAKTLAEFLFGSSERMIRLDMSEYQTPESTAKILGERGLSEVSDSLIERVRKQPFCVVLLDEFEKAHPNAWDLFLQMFDDGRLTDANGRTADFRHSIVILTSNLGATSHLGMGLGFLPDGSTYSDDQVLRAVSRTFKPELVNRLDKVIVFQPLSRPLMREILQKELQRVLERRGLRHRDWVVEWEPSAIEFLLDKGFSANMGARPLKRAIDHYLLAPLAATLVEHRFPQGDQFLFVRSNGTAIEVEFVDPDEDVQRASAENVEARLSLKHMILSPSGSPDEHRALVQSCAGIAARLASADWRVMKSTLEQDFNDPGVWTRPDRHRLFARFSLMDRVEEAARTVERLKHRLESGHDRDGHGHGGIVARLALQVLLVEQGIADVVQDAPIDALLMVEPVFGSDGRLRGGAWRERVFAMYHGWANRRHMQFAKIDATSGKGVAILQVGGFGAYRTLQQEAGLHVFEQSNNDRTVARVSVVPGPAEEPTRLSAYDTFAKLLAEPEATGTIVRRYREAPAPLVRDLRTGWRTGRLDVVLRGDFDLIEG